MVAREEEDTRSKRSGKIIIVAHVGHKKKYICFWAAIASRELEITIKEEIRKSRCWGKV